MKKPKYSKKSAYDLSGPEPKGWAALAEAHRKQMKRDRERERIRRVLRHGPYEC